MARNNNIHGRPPRAHSEPRRKHRKQQILDVLSANDFTGLQLKYSLKEVQLYLAREGLTG